MLGNNLQLRHFDYRLNVGTIAAGKTIRGLILNLENDSSFMLRSRVVHCQSSTGQIAGQSGLQAYLDRFTGPDSEYLSEDLTRFYLENRFFGQYGSPLPLRPPVIYPPGGAIQVDVKNDGNAELSGVEIYFRGSKLFAPGVLPCLTYPERMATNWFAYPRAALALGISELRPDSVLSLQNDSDFVLRALSIGSQNPTAAGLAQYFQCYVQLKDQDGRLYSNLPVHVDACFGALGSQPYPASGANLATSTGPYHPPLLTPEIYIPASRVLYYDLSRNDAFAGELASACDLRLAFMGSKVYPK